MDSYKALALKYKLNTYFLLKTGILIHLFTTWYATRRNNLVMITKKDNTKIIFTPDERDSFIEQVESSI